WCLRLGCRGNDSCILIQSKPFLSDVCPNWYRYAEYISDSTSRLTSHAMPSVISDISRIMSDTSEPPITPCLMALRMSDVNLAESTLERCSNVLSPTTTCLPNVLSTLIL